ncbi:glycoside hydrolase family 88/105 protein [Enterococcus songbeiensis]
MKKLTALEYAILACDTMINKFKAENLPPHGHFHYHQGVFLSGVFEIYLRTGEERYFDFVKDWIDSIVDSKGNITWFDPEQLDDIQPGIILLALYQKTREPRYKKASDILANALANIKVNKEGGFWHKQSFANQMWLDGLYMVGPFAAEYAAMFHEEKFTEQAFQQAKIMEAKTKDLKTGLWFHAYDSLKTQQWANTDTGCSPEFWGRSIGWINIALLDEMKHLSPADYRYQEMSRMVRELLLSLISYQSEEGRWYQIVDKEYLEDNWLENSASCLFTTAIYRAIQIGILSPEYLSFADKGYQGIVKSLKIHDNRVEVGHVCIGTGVGDYEYYISRPVSVNDLHGMGAFLLLCSSKIDRDRMESKE